MNCVLIGYRGTGKSTVGKHLSNMLGMTYISVDDEIVKKAGSSIPEIVDEIGWNGFRDLESELINDLINRENVIIDTGGGVIERSDNIKMIRSNSCVFWLKASVDVIVSRIQTGDQRPALTTGKTFTEEVAEVLERRLPLYKSAADYEIETDDLLPEIIADKIYEIWSARGNVDTIR